MAHLLTALPFVYEPLDQHHDCTRLVTIEPSPRDVGPLRCRVRQVLFSQRPRYKALSYMWGDETDKLEIFLNDKRFKVTSNLFYALHLLRQSRVEDAFWIDAICINQDDIQEKNRQIRIMPHIYFRASKVIVWLGRYSSAQMVEEVSPLHVALRMIADMYIMSDVTNLPHVPMVVPVSC